MKILSDRFSKRLATFALLQFFVLCGLVWFIAGNERLFKNTVPIEQRLVSHSEDIRKKAQQQLLGLDSEGKKKAVSRLIPALDQPDAFVRKWAAISLALVGPEAQEAIPLLLQSVSAKEKDVAQAARVALSEIGAPDAQQLPALMITLQDPRESVRCEAALSIGKMGPAAKEAVPVLVGYLRQKKESPACFEDALAFLSGSIPAVFPPVLELLDSGLPEIRLKAAHVLSGSSLKDPEDITLVLRALGRETNAAVRTGLAKALEMPDTHAASPASLWTVALLNSQNETVRLAALDLLRPMNPPPPDLDLLWMNGFRDKSPHVRQSIARWVRECSVKNRKTIPLILKMMADDQAPIRRLGLETLRRSNFHSPTLLQKVAKAQRDPDAGVRCRASETLVESGYSDRVSIALLIGDLRKDEDTARCAEDVLGLAGLFDPDVAHSMVRLLQEEKDPDIRSRAATVLMHLGSRAHEAIPALLRAQKEEVPGAAMALKAVRAPNRR